MMKLWRLPPPYVMLFLAPLFWSTSNVAGKLSAGLLTPYEFTFWRWAIATVVMTAVFWPVIRDDLSVLKKRTLWLFVVGGSGFALFNIVLYSAYNRGASVTHVSIITAMIPLIVLLVDAFVLRSRVHLLQWIGMVLSFIGVVWVVAGGQWGLLLQDGISIGDQLAFVSTVIYAGYSLALRRAPDVHWASLLWAMCVAAMVVSTPFYVHEQIRDGWHMLSWQAWLLVLYVAIFIAIVSKLFYMEGVIAIGASRASLTMNLVPVFGVFVGVLVFVDETLSTHVWISLLLVAVGILLSEVGAKTLRTATEAS